MKKTLLQTILLISILVFSSTSLLAEGIEKLTIASNNRVLQTENGKPFFPITDTAWQMAWRLNQSDVLDYMQTRKDQKYNTIAIVAFAMDGVSANVYGEQPFAISGGKYNPLSPIIDTNKYDYWDHLDFIINSAQEKGLYVILLPAWGSRIAGDWSSGTPNDDVILNMSNASNYAHWISYRYKDYTNIIWMLGGDRSAVYGSYDYRPVFRQMAAGVLAGHNNQPLLMSYHPRKWKPNSSEWFHNDSWLSFNSIQDQPSDQLVSINHDYGLTPTKPTWLFEGGYEERTCSSGTYNDWQVRFQAYQTVFYGAFGYTYGHMSIWNFASNWKIKMQAAGANDMCHLYTLMSSLTNSQEFFSLVPDQAILDGDTGSMSGAEGYYSTCIVAIRTLSNDLAMVYSANGRNIRVKMSQLANSPMRARWFNPRSGVFTLISTNVISGSGAPIVEFNPPGSASNGNDYVLILDLRSGEDPGPEPEPEPAPYPDPLTSFFADTFNGVSSGTINDQTNAADRQFGSISPLDYTGDGNSLLNAFIGDANKSNWLILKNQPYISPNHNFNDVGTNYTISFDIKLNRESGSAWAGFGLHIGAVTQHDVMNGSNAGFYWWLQKGNGGQVLISEGTVAALGNRSLFHNSELEKFEDEPVHVNCVVSTKSFGGTEKVTTALFVNGEPITAQQRNGTIGYGTVFELEQSLTNNYNIFGFNKDSGVNCNVEVDNFTVRKTKSNIHVTDWTDDASSLISSVKTYTHAVNCNGSDVVINGVQFTGAPDASHPYDDEMNWLVTDYHNNWGMGDGTESTTVTGSGAGLAQGYFYSRISSTLFLYHLIPGISYTLTLYNNASSKACSSRLVPSDGDAAITVLDQNRSQGSVFRYTYIAPPNGVFSMTFDNSPVDSGDTDKNWRLYAFSNEMAIPECSLFMGFLTMAGLLIRRLNN